MTSAIDWNSSTSGTVVAYFSSGEDAQNAINELVDEGFPINEIGAVFHSGIRAGRPGPAAGSPAGTTENPTRPYPDDLTQVGSTGSAAGTSGAESGTSGVTPAGLATGTGTGFTGASRPGPIPGSEIPSSIPSELPSSLRSSTTTPIAEDARIADSSRRNFDRSYGEISSAPSSTEYERRYDSDESWWDKLKHLFSGDSDTERRREAQADRTAGTFAPGTGQVVTTERGYAEDDYPYSGSAFESSFVGMGLQGSRARGLSNAIRRGGAIVTVNAGSQITEAERILERNQGQIRGESENLTPEEVGGTASEVVRVRIFGRVQRVYPGYISSEPGYISSDQPTRKAS